MKYETFEDLYNDNSILIEFEFRSRFFELFNKILEKIDWYQEQEHDHIDGGNCSAVNDYYRKNIINLERIYKPLYNYVYDLPDDMLIDDRFPMVQAVRNSFVNASLPTEDEINKEYRGKPEWGTKLYKLQQKQMRLADILEGAIIWAYKLGCKDFNKEPKDAYTEKEKFYKEEHLQTREERLSHLQSYAHDSSIATMLASIYDMGYRGALEDKPGDFDNAANGGMMAAQDFLKEIFNK